MEVIEFIYLLCFFLGLGFAIISGLLSGAIGGGHEGADVSADGHDLSAGDVHFSPWSPVVIAMFIASFGGTGILLLKLGWSPWIHMPVAAVSGLVVASLTFYVFWKIISVTAQSSEPTSEDVIGAEAEVITPIPANGVGEITYTTKQQRFSGPARSVDNREIPSRAVVRIVRIVSNTFFVERSS